MASSYLEQPIRGYAEALEQAYASPSYRRRREDEAWARAFPERARARHDLLTMIGGELARPSVVRFRDH